MNNQPIPKQCPHLHWDHDSYENSTFTATEAKLTVPSWCRDCDAEDTEHTYKEEVYEYQAIYTDLTPAYNGAYETIHVSDLEELEYQSDDWEASNPTNNFTAIFNAWYVCGQEEITVKIEYRFVRIVPLSVSTK